VHIPSYAALSILISHQFSPPFIHVDSFDQTVYADEVVKVNLKLLLHLPPRPPE
jgi:hypothetical protein